MSDHALREQLATLPALASNNSWDALALVQNLLKLYGDDAHQKAKIIKAGLKILPLM